MKSVSASRGASALPSRGASALPSRGASALPSRGASAVGSAAGSVAGSVASSAAGSAAASPRGTTLPAVAGASKGGSSQGSTASSALGSSVGRPAGGARGKHKAGHEAAKKEEAVATGRHGRQQAKEERERKKAEEERKAAELAEARARIKAQQEEMKRQKDAEAAVKAAEERRRKGAELLIKRTEDSLAASKKLKEKTAQMRDSALQVAAQAAWSRLYEAAKDNNIELLGSLLIPPRTALAGGIHDASDERRGQESGGKRQKLAVGVRIPVDWASEELRGGGSNDRGYWSVDVVDVNARGGSMQRTALHVAAARGHLEAVRALCDDHGAAMDVVDTCGRCPLWLASKYGHLLVVLFLVDAGANADIPDSSGNSPAHVAVAGGYSDIVEVLVDAGANLNRQNNEGVSARDMQGKLINDKIASKLQGLAQMQQTLMDAPIKMSPWHDLAHDPLLTSPKGEGRAAAHALLALDSLMGHTKVQRTVSRSHPDVNFRLKRGHAILQEAFFLTCLVHAETGETQLLVSSDGFRTSQRVCEHLDMSSWDVWDIGALHVTPAGSALVALRDGRLLHTIDMFETCSWVDPGRAHSGAGDVLLPPESRPGSVRHQRSRPGSRVQQRLMSSVRPPAAAGKQDFHAAASFEGSKPGYVFKMDAQGLGYYFDASSADVWQPFAQSQVGTPGTPGMTGGRPELLPASFGASLLSIAVPDSNRIFVVGRAPRKDAEGEGRRLDADWARVEDLVQQLQMDPNAIKVQQFVTLAHRMGHTELTAAEAIAPVQRAGGVAKLEDFFEWHCRQVETVCAHGHTDRLPDTQTHRHTDTQTHRHTDKQTHRHTDTQTDERARAHTHTHTHTHTHVHAHTHTCTCTHTTTCMLMRTWMHVYRWRTCSWSRCCCARVTAAWPLSVWPCRSRHSSGPRAWAAAARPRSRAPTRLSRCTASSLGSRCGRRGSCSLSTWRLAAPATVGGWCWAATARTAASCW